MSASLTGAAQVTSTETVLHSSLQLSHNETYLPRSHGRMLGYFTSLDLKYPELGETLAVINSLSLPSFGVGYLVRLR